MDRRGFLKSIGKVTAGLVIAPSVVKAVEPDGFKKVKSIRDIRGKGMSQKEFNALGLPEMKPIELGTTDPEKFDGFAIRTPQKIGDYPLGNKTRGFGGKNTRAYVIEFGTNKIYKLDEQQRS